MNQLSDAAIAQVHALGSIAHTLCVSLDTPFAKRQRAASDSLEVELDKTLIGQADDLPAALFELSEAFSVNAYGDMGKEVRALVRGIALPAKNLGIDIQMQLRLFRRAA
jgi:hypothetical protein